MAERLYTIEDQIPVRGNVNGRLTDLIEVHWVGPNGIRNWVRVPSESATDQLVDALIRVQLEKQLAIARLGAE